jgi:hypothetical protein
VFSGAGVCVCVPEYAEKERERERERERSKRETKASRHATAEWHIKILLRRNCSDYSTLAILIIND